jgi:CheY-like chemotaxis protein/PAS domain-containing protein
VAEKKRILVLEGPSHQAGDTLTAPADWELVRVDSATRGLALLQTEHFDGIYADTRDPDVWRRAETLLEADRIFQSLPDGVAVITPELRIASANRTFDAWCGGSCVGRKFYEALGSPEILGPDYGPFHTALAGQPAVARLHCPNNQSLQFDITPVRNSDNSVVHLICLGRDVTAEIQHQQKLEALHQAAGALAALTPEELSEMNVQARVEFLKHNIRRLTHDLFHYDVVSIRLLDRQTGRLEPLLQEGMTPEAGARVPRAKADGNGIIGFVAATGKSYLCPDTANDPLYLEGAAGARSSLTVPLLVGDEVIGTFNIESPQPNAFDEDDVKFTEILAREIADALHTLELLTAEKQTTASESIEAISREVVLPVDEILANATTVLDRYIGHDPQMAGYLKKILSAARSIKQSIQKVGEDMAATVRSRVQEPPRPALKGMRILVIDNDERVRRSAHSILGRLGCIVETARDGGEALTMARLSTYDAVLADIRLPDVPGYEIYRRVRDAQPKARVILMTCYGYDPSHTIVKARQEGLHYVLFKPFRVDQLLEALENKTQERPAEPGRIGAGVEKSLQFHERVG